VNSIKSLISKQKIFELCLMTVITVIGGAFGNKVELHLFKTVSHCAEAK
jgi:hypothetical protein